jgi:hypothetical protein
MRERAAWRSLRLILFGNTFAKFPLCSDPFGFEARLALAAWYLCDDSGFIVVEAAAARVLSLDHEGRRRVGLAGVRIPA